MPLTHTAHSREYLESLASPTYSLLFCSIKKSNARQKANLIESQENLECVMKICLEYLSNDLKPQEMTAN